MQQQGPKREENHEEAGEDLREQSHQGMTEPSSARLKAGLGATGTERDWWERQNQRQEKDLIKTD